MKTRIAWMMSILLVGFLLSCENNLPNLIEEEITSISEDEINSLKVEDIVDEDAHFPMSFDGGDHGSMGEGRGNWTGNFADAMSKHRFNNDCVTVTDSGEEYPREIIIDYGDGCEGKHGEVITGKIVITMTADMKEAGAVYTMKYENFTVGDKQVSMEKTRTNEGQNGAGNWVLSSSQEKTITYEDGSTSSRVNQSSTEWISGYETDEKEDNVFYRTGSGTVVTSEGEEYTREITTPLLFDRSCDYIKEGVIKLNKPDSEVIIDFGEGTCDEWATVTKDGVTEEIDLSERGKKGKGFCGGKGKGGDKGKGGNKGKGGDKGKGKGKG